MKTVHAMGHSFDCLPGHVAITRQAKGGTVRVATMRAVSDILDAPELRHKKVGHFKLTVILVKPGVNDFQATA